MLNGRLKVSSVEQPRSDIEHQQQQQLYQDGGIFRQQDVNALTDSNFLDCDKNVDYMEAKRKHKDDYRSGSPYRDRRREDQKSEKRRKSRSRSRSPPPHDDRPKKNDRALSFKEDQRLSTNIKLFVNI